MPAAEDSAAPGAGVRTRAVVRVPPHAYFVVSAVFHYLGPAFAVLLFALVEPLGVAWLRIASAALIFALWRRPWRTWWSLDRSTKLLLLGWAAVLAVMNSCFYLAIDRLPLGTVAAVEFLPVIALAAMSARTLRNLLALILAVGGVYLLTDVRLVGEHLGFIFATANAALFAAYIVLGHRVARVDQLPPIDGLALSMMIAAAIALPIGITDALPAFTSWMALAAGFGVGISSSVIPYICDQLAMRCLDRATYALMVSLLPATATVIGIVVLAQVPVAAEIVGVLLVIGGVAIHHERTSEQPDNVAGDEAKAHLSHKTRPHENTASRRSTGASPEIKCANSLTPDTAASLTNPDKFCNYPCQDGRS
jgi:inner membrane transporter RhtA